MEANQLQLPYVTFLRSSAVGPAQISSHDCQRFYLSSLDLYWRVIPYIKRILFFSTDLPFFSLVSTLKQSLALALSHFFPYAGRLARDEGGRFYVDCSSDGGAEFVEASIDLPLSALEESSFQMQPFFEQLAGLGATYTGGSDRCHTPLLLVQVTQFLRGGGIALGVAYNHVISDGYSLWHHFMTSWAEIARGRPLSNPPQHNRLSLKIDHPSPEIAHPPFEFGVDDDGNGNSTQTQTLEPRKHLVQRVFHFTSEQIQKLKDKVAEEEERANSFSSYEATLSHLWKCFARARGLPAEERVHIVVLIDCRNRLLPPLGHAYFGNAVFSVKAMATTGELLKESLAATAGRIHRQIATCSNKSVKAFMHWLELRDTIYGNFKLDTVGATVASFPRFPVYEVDFGWGKAQSVRPGQLGDGMMCFFPGREGGRSMDVCICLECSAMEALQSDPFFMFS